MSNFFDDFFAPKTVFWKNHYWGGSEIDCFEPIFGFLMQFCFQKQRSGTWDPKHMFSAPSGHSNYVDKKRGGGGGGGVKIGKNLVHIVVEWPLIVLIKSLLQAICFKVADINAKNICILIKVYSCLDCANKLSATKLSTNRKSLIFLIGRILKSI